MWRSLRHCMKVTLVLTIVTLLSVDTALACRWLRARRSYCQPVCCQPVYCPPVSCCPSDCVESAGTVAPAAPSAGEMDPAMTDVPPQPPEPPMVESPQPPAETTTPAPAPEPAP
ncbi:MAG: hypothetical protein KDA59_24505, partial [Planctomycetales bacterium]|nr:hypothetical protein [Planctomycetales bacterium]